MTVFQVLTGENWNDVLFNSEHALKQDEYANNPALGGEGASAHIIAVIYFVLLNCVGNFMILNLFLAILLSLFEDPPEEEEEEGSGNEKYKIESAKVAPLPGSNGADAGDGIGADTPVVLPVEPREGSTNYYHPRESSFFIFSPQNPIRILCFKLVDHPTFDNIILVLIAISTVMLCMDEPHLEYCTTRNGNAAIYGVESCQDILLLFKYKRRNFLLLSNVSFCIDVILLSFKYKCSKSSGKSLM